MINKINLNNNINYRVRYENDFTPTRRARVLTVSEGLCLGPSDLTRVPVDAGVPEQGGMLGGSSDAGTWRMFDGQLMASRAMKPWLVLRKKEFKKKLSLGCGIQLYGMNIISSYNSTALTWSYEQ